MLQFHWFTVYKLYTNAVHCNSLRKHQRSIRLMSATRRRHL